MVTKITLVLQLNNKYSTLKYLTAKMDKRVQKPAHADLKPHSLALPLGEKTEWMPSGEAMEAAAAQGALNNEYPGEPSRRLSATTGRGAAAEK